jgi:hypothetical protein
MEDKLRNDLKDEMAIIILKECYGLSYVVAQKIWHNDFNTVVHVSNAAAYREAVDGVLNQIEFLNTHGA